MPVCQKCGKEFPNRLKIRGKTRNLHSRKFCVNCSPFKIHNTRNLIGQESAGKRRCPRCGRLLPIENFYGRRMRGGNLSPRHGRKQIDLVAVFEGGVESLLFVVDKGVADEVVGEVEGGDEVGGGGGCGQFHGQRLGAVWARVVLAQKRE